MHKKIHRRMTHISRILFFLIYLRQKGYASSKIWRQGMTWRMKRTHSILKRIGVSEFSFNFDIGRTHGIRNSWRRSALSNAIHLKSSRCQCSIVTKHGQRRDTVTPLEIAWTCKQVTALDVVEESGIVFSKFLYSRYVCIFRSSMKLISSCYDFFRNRQKLSLYIYKKKQSTTEKS